MKTPGFNTNNYPPEERARLDKMLLDEFVLEMQCLLVKVGTELLKRPELSEADRARIKATIKQYAQQ